MIEYAFNRNYTKLELTAYNSINIEMVDEQLMSCDSNTLFDMQSAISPSLKIPQQIFQTKWMKKHRTTWRETTSIGFINEIEYTPGDAIGIFAPNTDENVERLMNLCGFTDQHQYKIERTGLFPFSFCGSLHEFFKYEMDLTGLPRKALLAALASNSEKKEELEYLCSREGHKDYLKLARNMNTLVEIIDEFGCKPTLQDLITYCDMIKPRYYSLINQNNEQAEILIGIIKTKTDKERYGHVSAWICKLLKDGRLSGTEFKVCYRKNKLVGGINRNEKMVCFCTGTGIALFIAFYRNIKDKNQIILIYGFRNDEDDLSAEYELNCKIIKAKSSEGRYVQAHIGILAEYLDEGNVLVCGNQKMQAELYKQIKEEYPKIVKEKRLFFDSWR